MESEQTAAVATSLASDPLVRRLCDAVLRCHHHQPSELLAWLVDDVLAGFGVPLNQPPPPDLAPWLRETSGFYASAVIRHPFEDVLGVLYQTLASSGRRGALGRFFTPEPITRLMAQMLVSDGLPEPVPEGRLLRALEPACGSGAMLLAFMETVVERQPVGLVGWSLTAIDLDSLCARMCATQILANLHVQRLTLGELLVFCGNALGPAGGLSVVVHATAADLSPDLVLPALHPGRLAVLRGAVERRVPSDLPSMASDSAVPPAAEGAEPDLFADLP